MHNANVIDFHLPLFGYGAGRAFAGIQTQSGDGSFPFVGIADRHLIDVKLAIRDNRETKFKTRFKVRLSRGGPEEFRIVVMGIAHANVNVPVARGIDSQAAWAKHVRIRAGNCGG